MEVWGRICSATNKPTVDIFGAIWKLQYIRFANGVTRGLNCCDRKSRAAYAQSFALWQQATIEFTCHDHSPRMLVVTFNCSHARIIRDYTPRSLYYCLFAPHICMVLFFTHIPFVVNHTINPSPPERLQQNQGGHSLAEGGPLVTIGVPPAKTR